MKFFLIFIFIIFLFNSFKTVTAVGPIEININASQDFGPVKLLTGILQGITYEDVRDYAKTIDLISALKPRFWRLSGENVYKFVVDKAKFPQTHNTEIDFTTQDIFQNTRGIPIEINSNCSVETTDNCFRTFDELRNAWETYMNDLMQTISVQGYVIDVYSIFGEPDWTWKGVSREQLFELFKIAHNRIRLSFPNTKIAAPGISFYDKTILESFLDYIVVNNLRLDELTWNEFDHLPNPEIIVDRVVEMRNAFSLRPAVCIPSCPEIYIDEYLGPQHHLLPGWNVGWLYYLEKAGVDRIHKACWDVQDKDTYKVWSTCWAGFNGMLMEDNITPQHIYWVYKEYAEGVGKRLAVDSSASRVVALASKNDEVKTIRILAGRYDGNSGQVILAINNYPYKTSTVTVEIQRIPTNGNVPLALASPITLPVQILNVAENSFSISIDNFQDNEAYFIKAFPDTTPPAPPLKGDFNSDNKVNNIDFASFKNAFKSIFNSIFDLNSDTVIDVKDLGVLMSSWMP